MTFFTTTRLLSALMLATIAAPVAASAAEPAYDTRSEIVSTAGLDATKSADQAILRHRIAVAAHHVCDQVTQGDGLASPAYAECFGRATADANATLASAGIRVKVASITQ